MVDTPSLLELGKRAQAAARVLARTSSAERDAGLLAAADGLELAVA
ncbi:MAG: hypothetical protein QOG97_1107, partial [Acidimicrobiaceae bacterium]|nr:hypothetical protein [Acidimicrobiaceae bacterium]